MQAAEAKEQFAKAEKLYADGQFANAFTILAELDKAYPKQKNIMLLRAYCLAGLYRAQDAVLLCDRILARFDCPEAHDLKIRLVKNDGLPVMPGREYGTPLPQRTPHEAPPSRAREFATIALARIIDILIVAGGIIAVTISLIYTLYG
jgi:hypothetical protein